MNNSTDIEEKQGKAATKVNDSISFGSEEKDEYVIELSPEEVEEIERLASVRIDFYNKIDEIAKGYAELTLKKIDSQKAEEIGSEASFSDMNKCVKHLDIIISMIERMESIQKGKW